MKKLKHRSQVELENIQDQIFLAKSKYGDSFKENQISDGYHTFQELYDFRKAYNALLFNLWSSLGMYNVHKSKRHSDGEKCFNSDNWFIVVAELPEGQISNHYKVDEDWDLFQIPEFEKAQVEYDGHTSQDVLLRMNSLLKEGGIHERETYAVDIESPWFQQIIELYKKPLTVENFKLRQKLLEQYGIKIEQVEKLKALNLNQKTYDLEKYDQSSKLIILTLINLVKLKDMLVNTEANEISRTLIDSGLSLILILDETHHEYLSKAFVNNDLDVFIKGVNEYLEDFDLYIEYERQKF